MDPLEFLYLIVPLGVLVGILVVIVMYVAEREETIHWKELEVLNEFLDLRDLRPKNVESILDEFVHYNLIDARMRIRLAKMLEFAAQSANKTPTHYFATEEMKKEA